MAYHEGLTGSVKINPEIYANYRRYPEGDFRGQVDDFKGILIHEISHGLPKLDFPPVSSDQNDAKWNAPEWKENAAPIESGKFARSIAAGHGVTGIVRLLGGTEQFREESREELRAIRITNAVMSEVREEYKPRLYYDDPGMGKAQCDTPEGKKNYMQGGGVATEIGIRLKHLGGHLLDNSDKSTGGQDNTKQHGRGAVKDRSDQNSDTGTTNTNRPRDQNVSLNNLGKVAADQVLAIIGEDPTRPQAAVETIRTRIAENQATVMAKGETYSVQRVEKMVIAEQSDGTQTNDSSVG